MSKIQISESNSQRVIYININISRCWLCQRYKFLKAIHNKWLSLNANPKVVDYVKDTNFWKQFTTYVAGGRNKLKLLIMSKIQISESNSQQSIDDPAGTISCWLCQRYKFLKAIHNIVEFFSIPYPVVDYVKDTNFWKQFTTKIHTIKWINRLLIMSKIQISESNSQQNSFN